MCDSLVNCNGIRSIFSVEKQVVFHVHENRQKCATYEITEIRFAKMRKGDHHLLRKNCMSLTQRR